MSKWKTGIGPSKKMEQLHLFQSILIKCMISDIDLEPQNQWCASRLHRQRERERK